MDAVVTNLQMRQAGAGLFPCLEVDQELSGVFAERLQFVEFAVVAGFQYTAVTNDRGRVVDDGFFQQCRQFRVGAGDGGELLEVWGFELRHCHLQFGQCAEGVTQAGEVAGAGITQADPRKNPLDVADFLELRLQSLEAVTVEQAGDRGLACQQHRQIA
ncbi:hypothetical protein D3C81_1436610 [compost metagenome]